MDHTSNELSRNVTAWPHLNSHPCCSVDILSITNWFCAFTLYRRESMHHTINPQWWAMSWPHHDGDHSWRVVAITAGAETTVFTIPVGIFHCHHLHTVILVCYCPATEDHSIPRKGFRHRNNGGGYTTDSNYVDGINLTYGKSPPAHVLTWGACWYVQLSHMACSNVTMQLWGWLEAFLAQ